ncbi:MAG: hypothetical protein HUU35_00700 [Armatimonadetes bacterium]|nr:hypothetical protein [Armatimonadota bacterium]
MLSRASLALLLALTACTRSPAPPPPEAPVTFTARALGVSLDSPANWPAREVAQDGGQFVVVEASPQERLVLSRLAGFSGSLEASEAQVAQQVAAKFPRTTTRPSQPATVAGRPALRTEVSLSSGQQGVRYLVTGGWVVEFQTRPDHAALVTPAFEQVIATLRLP